MTIVSILFYLALAASISVYGWRTYRHVVHHETRHDRAARRREAALADAGDGSPPSTTTPANADRTQRPTRRQRTEVAKAPVTPVEDGALVRDVIRQELAKKQAGQDTPTGDDGGPPPSADAAAGRSGMFAKRRAPVAELLAGITMPCDLAPLMDRDDLDPSRAVFATGDHAAPEVAAALADELERLGFRVDSVGEREAVARKAEGDLHITIHEDLAAFPTAPRSGVVVELQS